MGLQLLAKNDLFTFLLVFLLAVKRNPFSGFSARNRIIEDKPGHVMDKLTDNS